MRMTEFTTPSYRGAYPLYEYPVPKKAPSKNPPPPKWHCRKCGVTTFTTPRSTEDRSLCTECRADAVHEARTCYNRVEVVVPVILVVHPPYRGEGADPTRCPSCRSTVKFCRCGGVAHA